MFIRMHSNGMFFVLFGSCNFRKNSYVSQQQQLDLQFLNIQKVTSVYIQIYLHYIKVQRKEFCILQILIKKKIRYLASKSQLHTVYSNFPNLSLTQFLPLIGFIHLLLGTIQALFKLLQKVRKKVNIKNRAVFVRSCAVQLEQEEH